MVFACTVAHATPSIYLRCFALGTLAFSKDQKTLALPDQFEIGRHTFFDFGPPFDYYELFLVRPMGNAASIEKIMLTPAGNVPATAMVEVASAVVKESVASFLGSSIMRYSGKRTSSRAETAQEISSVQRRNIAMQVQCGIDTRIIRSGVLDRDWFTRTGHPRHTSQTMELMAKLDQAVGPGPLEKPMFPVAQRQRLRRLLLLCWMILAQAS